MCVELTTEAGNYFDREPDEDKLYVDSDDKGSGGHQSILDERSYHDYNHHQYGYKPKKKKVYVPVFVAEKEKKKSKPVIHCICFVFFCFNLNSIRSSINYIVTYTVQSTSQWFLTDR